MKRDPNKGRVEFEDSDGTKYFLKMGTNEFCEIQDKLAHLNGYSYSRLYFWQALVKGDAGQRDLKLDDAGELMDAIGPVRVRELLSQTTLGKANAALEAQQKADAAAAKAAEEAGQPA